MEYIKPNDCRTMGCFQTMSSYFLEKGVVERESGNSEAYAGVLMQERDYWQKVFSQTLPQHPDFENAKLKEEHAPEPLKDGQIMSGKELNEWMVSNGKYVVKDQNFWQLFKKVKVLVVAQNKSDKTLLNWCKMQIEKGEKKNPWSGTLTRAEQLNAFYRGDVPMLANYEPPNFEDI